MIELREATECDWARLLAWRNGARGTAMNTHEISVREHWEWFLERLGDSGSMIWIVDEAAIGAMVPVGYVRADAFRHAAFLSVAIDASSRGHGIGREAIGLAVGWIGREWRQRRVTAVRAEVKKENIASLRMFAACGFVPVDYARRFVTLERSL